MRFLTLCLLAVLIVYAGCDEPVYAHGGGLSLRSRLRSRVQVQQVQYAQPVQVKQVQKVRQQVIVKPAPVLVNPYQQQLQFKQQLNYQPYPAVIQPAQAFLKMSYADQGLQFKQQSFQQPYYPPPLQFKQQQQFQYQQQLQQPYYQLPSQGAYCP